MSLAEELLADLDDMEGEEEEMGEEKKEDEEEIDDAMETVPLPDTRAYQSVKDVAKLAYTDRYRDLMAKLEVELARDPDEKIVVSAPLESDPQYKLMVELSSLASEIDNELFVVHKFVRDKYEKRFPDLESLVPFHLEYMAAVALLGNDINTKGHNKDLLGQILAPATCIVISVTASTNQGKPLEEEELAAVMEGCKLAEELKEHRVKMFQLVEMRMSVIAPNLTSLVGADCAAALVSQAGGLVPLARMPSCNILLLGNKRRALAGFSNASTNKHAGILFHHPVVQRLPPDFRKQVTKILANKVALAARPDSQHLSTDGAIGTLMTQKLQYRIDKLLEPPAVKANKALPKPLDKASKKRGGRRVRKMKERLGMTDYRKKANRMNFGELEEDIIQTNVGFGVGQMKGGGPTSGRIRSGVIDDKTRVKMSKGLQRQVERHKTIGGNTSIRSKATSGTASSVSFSTVQGLEIVNPNIRKDDDSGTKSTYFSSTATFLNVKAPKPKPDI